VGVRDGSKGEEEGGLGVLDLVPRGSAGRNRVAV